MPRWTEEAKAKELKTRAELGPRLGHAPTGGHRVTAPPRTPRATGAARGTTRGGEGQDAS